MDKMNFESLLQETGGFGRFQGWLIAVLLTNKLTTGWSMLQMTYAGRIPSWFCMGSANHTDHVNGSLNQCEVNTSSSTGATQLSKCSEFLFATDKGLTVINEWNLVCDLKWVKATVISIQMGGVLIGAFTAGQAGDWVGRKKTLYFFALIHSLLNISTGFSVSWQMFAVCRFFIGACIGGIFVSGFPYIIEFLPLKWRPMMMVVPLWPMSVSLFSLSAMFMENWSHLHIACGIIGLPPLVGYFFVPESVRWLTVKGRIKEAKAVVERMASMNRKPVPSFTDDVLQSIVEEEKRMVDAGKKYTYKDVVKDLYTARITFTFCFIWCSMSLIYYGISFGISSLAGNIYLNIFLLAILDWPVAIGAFFFVNRVGRKWTAFVLFTIACAASFTCLLVDLYAPGPNVGQIITILSLVAIAGVGSAWGVVAIWGVELYPTVTRNLGCGAHNTSARIGGMLAPFLINFDDMMVVSYMVIGGFLVVTSILTLVTPETKNIVLADSFTSGVKNCANQVHAQKSVSEKPPKPSNSTEMEMEDRSKDKLAKNGHCDKTAGMEGITM